MRAYHPDCDCRSCGHTSDCSVHNEPAYPSEPCCCGRDAFMNKRYLIYVYQVARNWIRRNARYGATRKALWPRKMLNPNDQNR
jgi:hypothetical protein